MLEAESWIGTRFHHQGRIKRDEFGQGGCDCIGLILGIAKRFNLKSKLDNSPLLHHDLSSYSKFPQKNRLEEHLKKHFKLITEKDIKTADIGLFRIGAYPQHVGIFDCREDRVYLIHTYQDVGHVSKHFYTDLWSKRLAARFSFNEL